MTKRFGVSGRFLQEELCSGVDEDTFFDCVLEDDAYEEYVELYNDDGVCAALAFAEEIVANCGAELCGATCDEALPFGYQQENFAALESFFADLGGCESLCVPGEVGIGGGNDELCSGIDEATFFECVTKNDSYQDYEQLYKDDEICASFAILEELMADCGAELCNATCDEAIPFGFSRENFAAVEAFFADEGCESLCVVGEQGISGGKGGNAYKFILIGIGGVTGLFFLLGIMTCLSRKCRETSTDSPVADSKKQAIVPPANGKRF